LLLISRDENKLNSLREELVNAHDIHENRIATLAIDFSDICQSEVFDKLDKVRKEHSIRVIRLLFNNVGTDGYGLFFHS